MNSVSLRPITLADTDNIIRWRNKVKRNFIFQKDLTSAVHQHWFEEKIKTGQVYQFIIVADDLGKDIGSIYLRDLDQKNQKAELGIFIGDSSARGQGLGQLAIRQILVFAFEELKLNKVFLKVFADNHRAINSYQKSGFIEDGYFKQDAFTDGQFRDLVFMSILRSDWLSYK